MQRVRSPEETTADEAADYLRGVGAHRLFEALLGELAVARPADPLAFLAERLRAGGGCTRRVVVAGGAAAAAAKLAARLGVPLLAAGEALRATRRGEGGGGERPARGDLRDGWVITLGVEDPAGTARGLLRAGLLPERVFVAPAGEGGAEVAEFAPAAVEALGEGERGAVGEAAAEELAASMLRRLEAPPEGRRPPGRPRRVVVLGPVGGGKRTQCRRLAREMGLVHVATGDVLRAEVGRGTALGREVADAVRAGRLVPDAVVVDLVRRRLARRDCHTRGWVLDGFPRTTGQATSLAGMGLAPSHVLLLSVEADVALKRVADGKAESSRHARDSEERLRSLLNTFNERVGALKEYYRPVLSEINGMLPPDEVHERIVNRLHASPLV